MDVETLTFVPSFSRLGAPSGPSCALTQIEATLLQPAARLNGVSACPEELAVLGEDMARFSGSCLDAIIVSLFSVKV